MNTPIELPAPLFGGEVTHILPVEWMMAEGMRVTVRLGSLDGQGGFVHADLPPRSYALTEAQWTAIKATHAASVAALQGAVMAAVNGAGWVYADS